MSAQSDAIDAVTAQLNAVIADFPPAYAAALAAASGAEVPDPAVDASTKTLAAAATSLVSTLQGLSGIAAGTPL